MRVSADDAERHSTNTANWGEQKGFGQGWPLDAVRHGPGTFADTPVGAGDHGPGASPGLRRSPRKRPRMDVEDEEHRA